MQWTLNGPDHEWFTRAEVIALLKVSDRTLTRLIREGLFPRGIRATQRSPDQWSGLDLAAYLYLRGRCHAGPVETTEESSEDEVS